MGGFATPVLINYLAYSPENLISALLSARLHHACAPLLWVLRSLNELNVSTISSKDLDDSSLEARCVETCYQYDFPPPPCNITSDHSPRDSAKYFASAKNVVTVALAAPGILLTALCRMFLRKIYLPSPSIVDLFESNSQSLSF